MKDGRKTQQRTWGLTMSLTTPMLGSEVAGGVTQTIVCLFREPDAGKLPVRFDERVVSRRREIVLLYER